MPDPTQRAIEALEKALKPLTEAHNAATDHFGEDDDGAINIYAGIEAINVALPLLRSLPSSTGVPDLLTMEGWTDGGIARDDSPMSFHRVRETGPPVALPALLLINPDPNGNHPSLPKEPASSPEGAGERIDHNHPDWESGNDMPLEQLVDPAKWPPPSEHMPSCPCYPNNCDICTCGAVERASREG